MNAEAVGVVDDALVHLVVGGDIEPVVISPVAWPSCWIGGLLNDVIDKEVAVGVDVGGEPVAEGGDGTDIGGGIDANGAGVNGATGGSGSGSIGGVANGGAGGIGGDDELEGGIVEATIGEEVGVLDDAGKGGGVIDGTRG